MNSLKIDRIIGGLLLVLLLTACKGSDGEAPDDGCYLTVYVYTPGNPIVTRSDVQYQDATSAENAIHKLQLWVFKHSDGSRVGYLEQDNVNLTNGSSFKMLVDPELADNPVNVDVYALANVSSANTGNSFSRSTTRAQLDAATLQGGYFFGTTTADLEQTVPTEGLPMTGILTNQPIDGQYPALRIGTASTMATVQLARCVSKLNFLFVRGQDDDDTSKQLDVITGITLNGDMIPRQEYLMLTEPHDNTLNPAAPLGDSRIHIVSSNYETSSISFGVPATNDIPIVTNPEADPSGWTYATGYTAPLSFGLTYLRESDKPLTGIISYKVVGEPDKVRTATFEMSTAGDFTRNHTWTVLVAFVGGSVQFFNVVDIGVTDWIAGGDQDHEVYNW